MSEIWNLSPRDKGNIPELLAIKGIYFSNWGDIYLMFLEHPAVFIRLHFNLVDWILQTLCRIVGDFNYESEQYLVEKLRPPWISCSTRKSYLIFCSYSVYNDYVTRAIPKYKYDFKVLKRFNNKNSRFAIAWPTGVKLEAWTDCYVLRAVFAFNM